MDKVIRTVEGEDLPDVPKLKRQDKILEDESRYQRIREVYDVNGCDLYIWTFNRKSNQSVYNPYFADALGTTEDDLYERIMTQNWDPFKFIRKTFTLLRIEVLQIT